MSTRIFPLLILPPLLACGEEEPNATGQDLAELQAEVERLREEVAEIQSGIQDAEQDAAERSDDIASIWAAVIENREGLERVITEDQLWAAIEEKTGPIGALAERMDRLEAQDTSAGPTLTSAAALTERMFVNPAGDVVLKNANLVLQNGTGETSATNGKGNLILGYSAGADVLSRSGSHNLVIGDHHAYTSHSGIVSGFDNQISSSHAVALGGTGARVSAEGAVSVGGAHNSVSGPYAAMVGGAYNTTEGEFSTSSGGQSNAVLGDYASVTGGMSNVVDADESTVAGGLILDDRDGLSSSVIAGFDDIVASISTHITEVESGLAATTAELDATLVSMRSDAEHLNDRLSVSEARADLHDTDLEMLRGALDVATDAIVSAETINETQAARLDDLDGRVAQADELMAFVTIDSRDTITFSGANIMLTNGTGDTATPNGKGNLFVGYNAYTDEERTGSHNVVVGDNNHYFGTAGLVVGTQNRLGGHGSAILGGRHNLVTANGSVAIAGLNSEVEGDLSAALAGAYNAVPSVYGLALGGYNNDVMGDFAVVAGGQGNRASGDYSLAAGGAHNEASGETSVVSGGQDVIAEAAISVGGLDELSDALDIERTRIDDISGAIEDAAEENRIMLSAFGEDVSLLAEDVRTNTENGGEHADLLATAATEREEHAALLSSTRDDLETTGAALLGAVEVLQETTASLISSTTSPTIGLTALAARTEATDEVVAGHTARLDALNDTLAVVDADLAAQAGTLAATQEQVDESSLAIEVLQGQAARSDQVLAFMSVNDEDDIVFSGANVVIQSGSGSTHESNAKGNLILGYNLDTTTSLERTGSHNLIIGDEHAFTSTAGIMIGTGHTLSSKDAAAIGGSGHTVSGLRAVAIGGANNTIDGAGAAAIGGQFNAVSGSWASTLAGTFHVVTGAYGAAAGGHTGTVTGDRAALVGGYRGEATANQSTVIGGHSNAATEPFGTAPIDTLSSSLEDVEDITAALGDSLAADVAANTAHIDALTASSASLSSAVYEYAESIDTIGDRSLVNAADIHRLEIDVAVLESEDDTLWTSIDDLDDSRVVADNFLSYVTVSGGGDLVFEGTNLVIRNGTSRTDEANGKGNIVIGYAEMDEDEERTGSHNLVIGPRHSYTGTAGIVAGSNNAISGTGSSVLSGRANMATGDHAVVIAGQTNIASGPNSVVVAGYVNESAGQDSVVVSGSANTSSALYAAVVSGENNDATGVSSAVLAGEQNDSAELASAIIAGRLNMASGRNSAIVSGRENTTSFATSAILAGWLNRTGGEYASVVAGYDNDADGVYSTVAGGFKNNALHSGAVVGGAYIDSTGLYAFEH